MRKSGLLGSVVALMAFTALAAEKPAPPPTLEVVSRFALSEKAAGGLVDIRWAGKDSVYLADLRGGVTEVRLAAGLPEIRRVSPPPTALGIPVIQRAAISDRWVVVAHLGKIAWKKLDAPDTDWRMKRQLGYLNDIDIDGDELVLLGWPPDHRYEDEVYERGGVVWRSDLSKDLADWEVLYERKEAARQAQENDLNSSELMLGSIRFLPKGGFVVAPVFIPGVFQFSASASLKRTWAPQDLWRETNAWNRGNVELENLREFLGTARTIEVVLPLPEGPAIVVREPRGDHPHYRLAVLGTEIEWYEIPIQNVSAIAQIRGDADKDGRIVLAGVARSGSPATKVANSEVVVMRLPD